MKRIQKMVLCLGVLAVLTAPLAGCGSTWRGMKDDWNDMTSSNDAAPAEAVATADASGVQNPPAQPVPQVQAEETTTLRTETTTTTTTFNR